MVLICVNELCVERERESEKVQEMGRGGEIG